MRKQLAYSPRPGYTLIEMLIVIMIAILLMVVSLPMLKTVMDDARPREASRILNSTLFTAKSRAAASGRLAGVEFIMQVVGDPNANPTTYQCTQMVMCEVPALYAGDATSSRATIHLESRSMSPVPGTNPPKYSYRLYLQNFPINSIDPGMNDPAPDNTTSTAYYLADQGIFEIRFDFRGPWYTARRGAMDQFTVEVAGNPPVGATSSRSGSYYRSAPFQIRRPPVRTGNPVELPKGTAIDMMFSGIGPGGEDFSDTAALRIMFTPEGSLFNYTRMNRQMMGSPVSADVSVLGTAHFLVGLPQKVTGRQEVADASRANLADGNALWVSIGRTSGVVTTNENNPLPVIAGNPNTNTIRQAYIAQCRLYATSREQKGGR